MATGNDFGTATGAYTGPYSVSASTASPVSDIRIKSNAQATDLLPQGVVFSTLSAGTTMAAGQITGGGSGDQALITRSCSVGCTSQVNDKFPIASLIITALSGNPQVGTQFSFKIANATTQLVDIAPDLTTGGSITFANVKDYQIANGASLVIRCQVTNVTSGSQAITCY